jgi:hypothetical protein
VATVAAPTLNIGNAATVGVYLENQNFLSLSSPAPAGGLQVTLTVTPGSTSLMQLAVNPTDSGSSSVVVTVPSGGTSAVYYVYGLASSGTAVYSASASGYATVTDTVTLAPSGIVITGPLSVSLAGGPQSMIVYTNLLSNDGTNTPLYAQNLAGQTPLKVAIGNSNNQAGTVASSVTISPGTNSSPLTFTPASQPATTTISVTQPAGYTTPNQLGSDTITVGP